MRTYFTLSFPSVLHCLQTIDNNSSKILNIFLSLHYIDLSDFWVLPEPGDEGDLLLHDLPLPLGEDRPWIEGSRPYDADLATLHSVKERKMFVCIWKWSFCKFPRAKSSLKQLFVKRGLGVLWASWIIANIPLSSKLKSSWYRNFSGPHAKNISSSPKKSWRQVTWGKWEGKLSHEPILQTELLATVYWHLLSAFITRELPCFVFFLLHLVWQSNHLAAWSGLTFFKTTEAEKFTRSLLGVSGGAERGMVKIKSSSRALKPPCINFSQQRAQISV